MGLFNALFGNSTSATSKQQGATTSPQAMAAYYYIAMEVIPERLFRDEKHAFTGGRTFIKSFQDSPLAVITELMVYVDLASNGMGGVPPNEGGRFAKNFQPICGDIGNNLKYLIIEYPQPLPMQGEDRVPVAGPFYSAFIYSEEESSVRYYVLRTGTTGRLDIGVARELLSDGTNFNLGSVSSSREDFTDFIKKIETAVKPICGGVDKDGNLISDPLFGIIYRYFPDASKPNTMILRDKDNNLIIPARWRPVVEK